MSRSQLGTMASIQTGDWIRIPSLFPGIWQVYRGLRGFTEDRWSLDEELKPSKRYLLFCYRLANDSWQRSFSHQVCEASLAQSVSSDERGKAEQLLSSDKKLARAFEKYRATARPIDLIANLGFGEFDDLEIREFPAKCSGLLAGRIDAGLTMDDVLAILGDGRLSPHRRKLPNQVTLQLVSTGHELRDGRFLYRRFKTLGF